MRKVFDIPVPDHLAKFATKELWDGYSYPFTIHEGMMIGKFILSLLIDKRERPFISCEYDSQLTISLSDTLAKRSPTLLKLARINAFLEDLFNRSLITWTKAQMYQGCSRSQAVSSFIKYYGINEKMTATCYQLVKREAVKPYTRLQNEKNSLEEI